VGKEYLDFTFLQQNIAPSQCKPTIYRTKLVQNAFLHTFL